MAPSRTTRIAADRVPDIATDWVPGKPKLAYDHCGEGTPVVFLHGVGGNRTNWRDQLAHIGAAFHAIAWDARGYGDSDDVPPPWSFHAYSEDLLRLLDHLDANTAHIVGLSMGGRIAQDFYSLYPARVASLTLCDTFARLATSPGATAGSSPDRESFMRARREPLQAGQQPADIAAKLADSLMGPGAASEHRQRLVESLSALRRSSYLQSLEVLAEHEIELIPEHIEVPTLVIFGSADPLTPPEIGRELHTRIRHSELWIAEGAGHVVNLERPDEFSRRLLDFLCGV